MVPKKFEKSAKPGSVMALMLFAVVLLLLSGIGVLSIGQTTRIFAIRTAADVAARSAADTGIAKAVWAMNRRLKAGIWSGFVWEFPTELPNSDATYSFLAIRARKLYGDIMPSGNDDLVDFIRSASWKEGDYVIKSVGRYAAERKVIYGIVRLKGVGDAGVLVRDSITLKSGTTVAARDSDDPTNLDPDVFLEIGTVSTADDKVVLNSGVVVEGNVLIGVNGYTDTVIRDAGASTGLKYPFPEEPIFPYVYPPVEGELVPYAYWDTEISIDNKDPNVLYLTESDNGRYTRIDLDSNVRTEKLVISSGNHVVLHLTSTGNGVARASISLGVGCEIVIEDGATLNIYVDGNILSGNDSGFNNLGAPPDLKIWGNWRGLDVTQDWQLNAKSEYFGQVYAPNAALKIMAKADMYGAFTAYSFNMMAGGNLYYDGALRDVLLTDEGVRFVLKRWYE